MNEQGALDVMFEVAPMDWWRFVPCEVCRADRGEACMMGGASWPMPARQPHAPRRRAAWFLHATLWLIREGYADDMIGNSGDRQTSA